jgi:hypothetical protein
MIHRMRKLLVWVHAACMVVTMTGAYSGLATAGPPISDDFNPATPSPNPAPTWEFYDPYNTTTGNDPSESTRTFDGTNALIRIPAGLSHDLWVSPYNQAPRLLQTIDDANFPSQGIEVKFESTPSTQAQMQGIIVQQTNNTLLRFDVFHDGTSPRLFVAYINGSANTVYLNAPLQTSPPYRRVLRSGSQWTYRYSYDGNSWTDAITFTRALTVTKVGIFAGTSGSNPPFTASADYFMNRDAPIPDSDVWAPPPPVITSWYGDSLSFGQLGNPQKWVNILGSVQSDTNAISLTYSLNGGPSQALAIGPDGTQQVGVGGRLVWPGDFNIEIDHDVLNIGPNTVVIRATDSRGQVATKTVTTNYTAGQTWPMPYTADWRTIANTQEVENIAQIVDGLWTLTSQGIRTVQTGYDRTIAIGDETWLTDYEVVVPITLHSNFSGVGFAIGWQGHEDSGSGSPRTQWPLQAIAWLRGPSQASELDIMTYGGLTGWEVIQAKTAPFVTNLETPYLLKTRSESLAGGMSRVYAKFWRQGSVEPTLWTLSADVPKRNGSVLLVAFNGDVTFGNVVITPITSAATPPTITMQPANQTVAVGQTATFSVAASGSTPLAYQWQRNGANIAGATSVSYTTPATVAADNGAVFRCIVSNAAGSATSNAATLTVTTSTASILSDDFNPATTEPNPTWNFYDPYSGASGQSTLTYNGTNALIGIPAGLTHDLWVTPNNKAPRLLQSAPNTDFGIEAKFESTPSAQYQMQGIIVQQTNDIFLRFDTYHNGASPHLFVAYINGANNTVYSHVALSSIPRYRRVIRSGNQWTYRYSSDGTTWTNAVTFTQALTVSAVGVFAGTNTPNPAFIGNIDYFTNLAAPIVDNDSPNQATPPTITMQPANQTVAVGQTATFSVAASGSTPLAYQWQRNGANIAGATSVSYTTPATVAADNGAVFRCIVSNAAGSATSNAATLTVTTSTASILSDDFNPATTEPNPTWNFYDPYSGASGQSTLTYNGTNALIGIPAGLTHDLWVTPNNKAPRLLQSAPNTDFGIEAKFESTPSAQYQMQGIIVQQTNDIFLRFDTYHNGASPHLFVAYINGANNTVYSHVALSSIPRYRRVIRSGNQWTYRYSSDGTTWTNAVTFTQALTVSAVGVFAGTNTPNPAFIGNIDYFTNLAAPIVDND